MKNVTRHATVKGQNGKKFEALVKNQGVGQDGLIYGQIKRNGQLVPVSRRPRSRVWTVS